MRREEDPGATAEAGGSRGGGAGRQGSASHRKDLEIPISGKEVRKLSPVTERKEERTGVSEKGGGTRCVLPREGVGSQHRPLAGATAGTEDSGGSDCSDLGRGRGRRGQHPELDARCRAARGDAGTFSGTKRGCSFSLQDPPRVSNTRVPNLLSSHFH